MAIARKFARELTNKNVNRFNFYKNDRKNHNTGNHNPRKSE